MRSKTTPYFTFQQSSQNTKHTSRVLKPIKVNKLRWISINTEVARSCRTFIRDMAYLNVIQWNDRMLQWNMPYPVWKWLTYGTAQISIIGSLCAGQTHALLYISVVIEFNLLRIPVGWALVVRNALVVCTTGSVDAALLKKEQNSWWFTVVENADIF